MKSKAANDESYVLGYQSKLSCNLTTRSIISNFTCFDKRDISELNILT